MSTFKKLLALTLALAMVLSVSAFAGYKADTYKDAASIDEDCESAIELMYALEIMKGDANGNFNPEATITRAEVAKMIYVILNYGNDDLAVNYKGANVFTDVVAGSWYEGYVTYAYMHKLVNGRGNGTFGPNDPVTTAEAAKMLLTAIGYSAEGRGYTGANWAFNVLSDARILGLLDGYNYSTTGYAPRQWVAVMVENALDCFTFDTMKPTFSGLLVSGEAETAHKTMGEKYFGFDQFTAVAIATKKTTLEKTFSENGILFDLTDKDGEYVYDLKGTGLGVDDLGQEFKVIIVDGSVVSVRNTGTSVVAESLLRDVDAKTITGTSSNKYNNKYEFTIDELSAKFDGDGVNQITLGNEADKVKAVECKDTDLYSQANGKTNNIPTEIKAIDKDGDGDIDYCVFTVYNYAVVTKTGTSRAYGDYVMMEDKNEKSITWNKGDKLYVDDVIICEDELEEGNYVKYNYDHENSNMMAVEVLPVEETTLDRVTNKGTYTLGGEVYVTSDAKDAFGDFDLLTKANVDETFVIAYDGDMLVVVAEPDAEPTTLDEINAQLCVVVDTTTHYYTGWDRVNAVEILTIDNEKAQYILADQSREALNAINVADAHGCKQAFVNYLYVFDINDDDEITLEPFAATAAGLAALDPNKDVINGYWAADVEEWAEVSDDFLGDIIALENTYFVGSTDEDGDFTIEAKTLEALEGMKAKNLHVEGLYDNGKYVHTLVAGYLAAEWVENDDLSDGYLYLNEEVYYDKADKENMAEVTFSDGTVKTIIIANENVDVLDMYTLYSFSYSKLNDAYTLTAVEVEEKSVEIKVTETKDLDKLDSLNTAYDLTADELVEGFIGDDIYVKEYGVTKVQRYDLTDCVFAVKNITLDLDKAESDVIEVTYEIEFVTLDELKEMETIFADYEDRHDFYFSDFTYAEEDLLYVEVYRVTDECQEVLKAPAGDAQ